jgi:hypothetical protein
MATADIAIGTEHGPGCTCRKLDPVEIEVSYTPVVVNQGCPGVQSPPAMETGERVIITWPRPHGGGVIPIHGVTLTKADTGEQILTGVKLALTLGTDTGYDGDIIEVEVTALVNEDGQILGSGKRPVFADGEVRTGVFRFAVAEMRVASAGPGPEISEQVHQETAGVLEAFVNEVQSSDRYPTKDSHGDEMTIDCLHHAITCVQQAAA